MPMTPETTAFLRELGMSEFNVQRLNADDLVSIQGAVLTSYLRAAYKLGAFMATDHFVWQSVADLMGDHGA